MFILKDGERASKSRRNHPRLGFVPDRRGLGHDLSASSRLHHAHARREHGGSGAHRRTGRIDRVADEAGFRLAVGPIRPQKAARRRRLRAGGGREAARRHCDFLDSSSGDPILRSSRKGNPHSPARCPAGRSRPGGKPRPGLRPPARDGQRRRLRGAASGGALLRFWISDEKTVFLLATCRASGGRASRRQSARAGAPGSLCRTLPPESGGRLPKRLWLAIGIFFLFTLANSSDAFLLLRARDCGIPLWELPLLWSFLQGVKALAAVPGGALSDRIGRTPAICLGWLVYCVSYLGFAFAGKPLHVWAIFLLYGLFFGLTEGAERALIADIVSERQRGRAFGVFPCHGRDRRASRVSPLRTLVEDLRAGNRLLDRSGPRVRGGRRSSRVSRKDPTR